MAEAAALTSIAKSALQLLASLAKEELLFLWNSGEELKRLEATIETLGRYLQDAEERKSKERSVQDCLSRLRDVMYDADDLFDALSAKALRKRTIAGNAFTKEVRLFFSKSNQLGFMFKAAQKVEGIRKSLEYVERDMKRFSFAEHQPLDQSLIRRRNRNKTHSFVREESVIGRDQDRDDIINKYLLNEEDRGEISHDRSFSVVAVIGFGGLGKTTLAQLVYNDQRVKQGFDLHLWACINGISNLEQVLIEIIASKEGRHHDLGLEKLQQKLREIIGGRRFLIVVDDVWDEDCRHWGEMESIFRCGKSGSRVLVTTRSKKVAQCLNALKPYWELDVLSDDSAWSLFVEMAFDHEEEISKYPELERIGKKIVSRCGNVPLAIKIVGSLLHQREREERIWSDFLDKKLIQVLSSSDDKTQESIKDVLMVSYNDLDPNLKLCFSCCSLFPKDYRFDKDDLVNLWISQGFIKPSANNEQSLEELGEACFFQLVERCFFQEVKEYQRFGYSGIDSYYDPYRLTAKVHDLLHDVAIDVAKTESHFFEVSSNKGNLRHVSIGSEVDDSISPCTLVSDPNTVRTLLLFPRTKQLSKSSVNQLLESFKMLRTLCLYWMKIDCIPDSIGEMIHLRYLDLSYNQELKHLPSSICKLHHLMIFVLRGCRLLEELPPKIGKLVSLRQLYIQGCDSLDSLPQGLRHLTSLVNLDRLIVHHQSGGLRYLTDLDNLSKFLEIELPEVGWPDAPKDAEESKMCEKRKLSGMAIKWGGNYSSSPQKMDKDEAKQVLEALRPHESLEYLKISKYGGGTLSSWVCTLKNIKELCLVGCDVVEYLEDAVRDEVCFPSLKILIVEGMENLKGWWRQGIPQGTKRPCLPKVSHVTISSCPKLKGRMPLIEGIEYLNLSVVNVKLVTELSFLPHDSNNKLKELHLRYIKGLESIPSVWIRHLTALQKLDIQTSTWFPHKEAMCVSCGGLAYLTALKELRLGSCKIADEDGDEQQVGNQVGMPWKALKGLARLQVAVGDKQLQEGLQHLTSLKCLEMEEIKGVEFESSSKALQNLHELTIGFGDRTAYLLEFGIQYLHSLKTLKIKKCEELYLGWKTLLISMKLEELEFESVGIVFDIEDTVEPSVEHQSQLRSLKIFAYEEGEWVHDIPWKSLGFLHNLTLVNVRDMDHLPDGIQHLPSLQLLYISDCEKLRSLPSWIAKNPTSLKSLSIFGCSEELKKRCQKESGEDWHLISRIDYTDIMTSRDWDKNYNPERSGSEEEAGKRGGCWDFKKLRRRQKFKAKKAEKVCQLAEIPEASSNSAAMASCSPKSGPSSRPPPSSAAEIHQLSNKSAPLEQTALNVARPGNSGSEQTVPRRPLKAVPLEHVQLLDESNHSRSGPSFPREQTALTGNTSELIANPPEPALDVDDHDPVSLPPSLKAVPLEYVQGLESGDIDFSMDDVAELVNRWSLSLVGAPIGGRKMSYTAMQRFVASNWPTGIVTPKILLHDNGLFVFQFDQEQHLLSTLERGPWIIEGERPLILSRWHAGMPLDMSCLEEVPVWVTLPNLDVRFWSTHMLSRIGSAIGRPILTDYPSAYQERISFARLLVQVSARKQLLGQVRLRGADGEVVYQRLQYDTLPPHCPKCSVFGHQCIDSETDRIQLEPSSLNIDQ